MVKGAAIGVLASLLAVTLAHGADPAPTKDQLPFADGPAQPDLETLSRYECPAWFRDAKFGIRTQWGPQNLPELGANYARDFKRPGWRAHDYHVAHFGRPDQVGFDAVIDQWTANKFEPAALVGRFAAAGARYVVALAADDGL